MKYDERKGNGAANRKIVQIISSEELFPVIFKKESPSPNWNSIKTTINKKYPEYSEEVISSGKVLYYRSKKDWPGFQNAVLAYMKDYCSKASPDELNAFAWTVFENCKDMTCVTEALEWSRRSFKDKENPMFIDTYANIIYKLGKKEEAIKWEEKALALSNNDKGYQETLDKMKKGVKTWKE
jgi:tetratricopeptide (TPR) repeat protein